MKVLLPAAACAALWLSQAGAQEIVDGSGAGISLDRMEALNRALIGDLGDPLSAQLRKVAHPFAGTKFERKEVICGYVNAKNGFGAYVGFRAFTFGGRRQDDLTIYDPATEGDALQRLAFNYSDCPWSE